MNKDRKEREREFHDQVFAEGGRERALKFYRIAASSQRCYRETLLRSAGQGQALEYGCGPGTAAFHLARQGARVLGIDISPVAIQQAREHAERLGLQEACDFREMDAERLDLPDRSVDLVCGSAILHHLDLVRSYAEIARVLRPGGVAVFLEPMGHNPVINWYRDRTPGLRTPDEHPLLDRDLQLARRWFGKVEKRPYHLMSLSAVPFRRMPGFGLLLGLLEGLDRALFTVVPGLWKHAWTVVVTLRDPRSVPSSADGS